jgi:hypothetical protein
VGYWSVPPPASAGDSPIQQRRFTLAWRSPQNGELKFAAAR